MAKVEVVFYCQPNGRCEFLEYLDSSTVIVQAVALRLIEKLEEHGSTLSRPHSGSLGNGLFELRGPNRAKQLRILYFFHGGKAVVTNALEKKTRAVPEDEIKKANDRRRGYIEDPQRHTWKDEE
jgi:phage-related protein